MIGFIDAAISRTRTTLLMLLVVVIAGFLARSVIPIANEPHVEVPYFYVGIVHEGISPEDAERLLVMPMEIELRKVEGVKELTAFASEGHASLLVEFNVDYDLDQALLDVREAVDRARAELPTTAEEPIVEELAVDDFPVIQVSLVGEDVPERIVYQIALAMRDDIEAIPSVLKAELQGHREELLEVIVEPEALEAYHISSEELLNTLQRNNRLIPAGSLDQGEGRFPVKVPSVVEEASDILDLPIRTKGDTVVTLQDVATIRRTFKDRTSYARFNGRPAISLSVSKRANANVIETVERTRAVVEAFRGRIPKSIDIYYSQDQASFARLQVNELQGNIFTAIALVMILVVAAMGFRSGVIVGLGIPVSLLFSVVLIYLFGYTFNFMVMFGMLLGLGMLIDGSIVVTEYADRKMGEGLDHRQAYSAAVKRMFWPVTASVATTLAAFLPLVFWPGMSGKFMRYLPVTVFTVLTGSLIYALLFGPVLGTIFGRPSRHTGRDTRVLQELSHGDPTRLPSFTGGYARLLERVCRHPLLTLSLIAGLLIGIFWAYGQFGRGLVFFTESDPKFVQVSVRAQGNLSADEVNRLVLQVEEEILQVRDIEAVNTRTRLPGSNNVGSGEAAADRIGSIFIELVDESLRSRDGHAVLREMRRRTADIPGITVEIAPMEQGPPTGKDIQLEFASRDRGLLEPAVERVRKYINTLPELVDISDTRALPMVEWRIRVDRAQAALFGADVSSAGIAVQLVTNGVKVAEYRPDNADDAVDIRVRYPEDERGIQAMEELRVSTAAGQIPLSNFATFEAGPAVDTIQRIDAIPVEYIRADVVDGVLPSDMVQTIQSWLSGQDFDPSLDIRFRGANEEQEESLAFVQVAFLMSLLLMFILLVTQFNSLYQSCLILLAVVMSTAGVLAGLLITGGAFSAILTGVGVVALAGIVVNNNIVLIDTFNHLRRQHPELPVSDVIVRTGAQRLRPVVLTTVTTVFGLLPLAMGLSIDLVARDVTIGGQMTTFWAPLSQAIVFGLTFSTLLTLVATPAMLVVPTNIKAWCQRRMHGARRLAAAEKG